MKIKFVLILLFYWNLSLGQSDDVVSWFVPLEYDYHAVEYKKKKDKLQVEKIYLSSNSNRETLVLDGITLEKTELPFSVRSLVRINEDSVLYVVSDANHLVLMNKQKDVLRKVEGTRIQYLGNDLFMENALFSKKSQLFKIDKDILTIEYTGKIEIKNGYILVENTFRNYQIYSPDGTFLFEKAGGSCEFLESLDGTIAFKWTEREYDKPRPTYLLNENGEVFFEIANDDKRQAATISIRKDMIRFKFSDYVLYQDYGGNSIQGKQQLQTKIKNVSTIENCSEDNKIGLFFENGKVVTPCHFDNVYDGKPSIIKAKIGNNSYWYGLEGELLNSKIEDKNVLHLGGQYFSTLAPRGDCKVYSGISGKSVFDYPRTSGALGDCGVTYHKTPRDSFFVVRAKKERPSIIPEQRNLGYAFIDTDGTPRCTIPTEHRVIPSVMLGDYYIFIHTSSNKKVIYNTDGEKLYECKYDEIFPRNFLRIGQESSAFITGKTMNSPSTTTDDRFDLINIKNGNVVLKDYENILFWGKVIIVKKGGKVGVVLNDL